MISVTLDTCLLITLLDEKDGSNLVKKILDLHRVNKIKAFVSNRIFEPDTAGNNERQKQFEELLKYYEINIQGSVFRSNVSNTNGRDLVAGGQSMRSVDEIQLFKKIVGPDPSLLNKESVGNRFSNKIGDYDALKDHFCSKRDIFITLDTKDYLHSNNRKIYKDNLGLIIMNPTEFLLHMEALSA